MIHTFYYPHYDNHEDNDTAPHRVKFGIIETENVKRWQQCVKFGWWITANESRLVAGWYHSGMTIGPDDKPIRTSATLHSLANPNQVDMNTHKMRQSLSIYLI